MKKFAPALALFVLGLTVAASAQTRARTESCGAGSWSRRAREEGRNSEG